MKLHSASNKNPLELFFMIICWSTAIICTLSFGFIICDILLNGIKHLSLSFLTSTPTDAGRAGGILPIIISTLLIVAVAMAVSFPLAIGTAVLLGQYAKQNSLFIRFIRQSLNILASVPSIVFGLFGSVFFCVYLKMGFSILAGGLTLSCMVLPIFIRTVEEGFRAIPQDYLRAAEGLGFSKTTSFIKLMIPVAMPSILSGFILGFGRAMAETAALIFTSGYVDRMPESLLDSGRSMSVHIYDLAMNIPGANGNAYATAIVLVSLLLIINMSAALIAKKLKAEK